MRSNPFPRPTIRLRLGALALAAATIGAVIGPAVALAQTGGGSTYSIFNLGDLQTSSTVASAGRGGVECAVPSTTILNSLNPAGWQDLRLVTLQAGLNFEQFQVSDGSSTLYQNNSRLQDFAVGLPYSEKLGGLAFGIHPYSTVNYRTQVVRQVPFGDTTTAMRTTYSGRGGISEAFVGGSIKPLPWLSVGATANLFFGSIRNQSDVTFDRKEFAQANYLASDRYVGTGGRIGVQAQPTEDIRLGAVFETGSDLEGDNLVTTMLVDNGVTVLDTVGKSTGTVTVPPRITFGASFVTGRFLLSGDMSMQSWDATKIATSRAENRFAVGVDRLPSTSLNASGFERWTFRFGAYYRQTYYQPLNGEGINQMALTLGARWPITSPNVFNSSTALDVALELGKRGNATNGLTEEFFGRVAVELSVSELWFVRSRR